jgi:hypothetical protein
MTDDFVGIARPKTLGFQPAVGKPAYINRFLSTPISNFNVRLKTLDHQSLLIIDMFRRYRSPPHPISLSDRTVFNSMCVSSLDYRDVFLAQYLPRLLPMETRTMVSRGQTSICSLSSSMVICFPEPLNTWTRSSSMSSFTTSRLRRQRVQRSRQRMEDHCDGGAFIWTSTVGFKLSIVYHCQ